MVMRDDVIDWLMSGDPVIRWQTMRDLLEQPESEWQAERARVADSGWGLEFANRLGMDDNWPPGRWTDTVWTLLTLMDCGMPPNHPEISRAARQFVNRSLTQDRVEDERWLSTR